MFVMICTQLANQAATHRKMQIDGKGLPQARDFSPTKGSGSQLLATSKGIDTDTQQVRYRAFTVLVSTSNGISYHSNNSVSAVCGDVLSFPMLYQASGQLSEKTREKTWLQFPRIHLHNLFQGIPPNNQVQPIDNKRESTFSKEIAKISMS